MLTTAALVLEESGAFHVREIEVAQPSGVEVLIAVEACGMCHNDAITVDNRYRNVTYPRAPGHEIAGRILALGDQARGWSIGDRVAVGWLDRRVENGIPFNQRFAYDVVRIPGVQYNGGFAAHVLAPANSLARIPDNLDSKEAAPLLCAGVTTFNALRSGKVQPGEIVAILGLGPFGHLAVQFASKMGFETVAVGVNVEAERFAKRLGATHYIDGVSTAIGRALNKLGGAQLIIGAESTSRFIEDAREGLTSSGAIKLISNHDSKNSLIKSKDSGTYDQIVSWPSGLAVDLEATMEFALQNEIRSMSYIVTMEEVQSAYDKMMKSISPVRPVLTMEKPQIDVLSESISSHLSTDEYCEISKHVAQIEDREELAIPADFRAYLSMSELVEQAEPKINILLSFSAPLEIEVLNPANESPYKYVIFADWFLDSKWFALGFLGDKVIGVFIVYNDGEVVKVANSFTEFVHWLRNTDLDRIL